MSSKIAGKVYTNSNGGSVLAVSEPSTDGVVECLRIVPVSELAGRTEGCLTLPHTMLVVPSAVLLDRREYLPSTAIGSESGVLADAVYEKVVRGLVLADTRRYYSQVHKVKQDAPFVGGSSRVNYSGRVYNSVEVESLVDASLDFFLTADRYDRDFCYKLTRSLKSNDQPTVKAVTVNSGSSANLLAAAALTSPKLGSLALKPGDEVITVAAGFPTTVAPLLQNSLVPVFVDVELGSYNIDASQIESAITGKTKAIFIAHTLGVPFDMDAILSVAQKHKLWVVEDNCDALGAEIELKGNYELIHGRKVQGKGYTGTFGHLATSSFYPAHQITMGEGGAVYSYDSEIYKALLSLRDWGRDCWCAPGKDDTCGKRFDWRLGGLPHGYDHKFTYSHVGYNLKITDMQAAVGCAQLDKLQRFVDTRRRNWTRLKEGVSCLEEFFVLHKCADNVKPSPFGFAMTLRDGFNASREEITSFLEESNIQTRTLFAGNLLRQPALACGNYPIRIRNSDLLSSGQLNEDLYAKLPNTETIMNRTFWVGVYPGISDEMVDFMATKIIQAVERAAGKKIA